MFQFDGAGVMVIPGMVAAATGVPWVGPGSPIPVREIDTSSVSALVPHSVKAICVLTREMVGGCAKEWQADLRKHTQAIDMLLRFECDENLRLTRQVQDLERQLCDLRGEVSVLRSVVSSPAAKIWRP